MPRPHVEYIQTQAVAWGNETLLGMRRGVRLKLLSCNADRTDSTALVEYPPGTNSIRPYHRVGAEEIFILSGELTLNDMSLKRHSYAYLPPRYEIQRIECVTGAVVLTFLNGDFGDMNGLSDSKPEEIATPIFIDTPTMAWDSATIDPRLAHLRLSRKILRISTEEPCRTYLLAGLPHGRPARSELQLERHEYAEEMFLISGDMASPQGVMRPGAYFYRPEGKTHGPHFSDNGFFMFLRNPGTTTIRTEWLDEFRTLPADPPYDPILPPESPETWRRPYRSVPEY